MIERTLVNIKPDAVAKNIMGEIIKRIENAEYRIVSLYKIQLTKEAAAAFYAVHKGQYFYEPLIEFMTSGPCVPMVVEGENAVHGIRELVGNTDPGKAAEGTIRHDFGETVRRNAVHASDSLETAQVEIPFFFKGKHLVF